MNLIAEYETPCRYRESGTFCHGGSLYDTSTGEVIIFEGLPLRCGACSGKGYILTRAGEQLVEMLWRHLEPKVVAAIDDMRPRFE